MRSYPAKDMQNIKKAAHTREEVEKMFPGFMALIDCTEQQMPRPRSKERRKAYHSGKKQRHTIKNQLMVNNSGLIIHKVNHKKGHRHDYGIYKKNHPITPKEVANVFDLGYLGVEKDLPEQMSSLPYKKKRNQEELPVAQKEYNRGHAKKRIVTEHTICRLKKYKIMNDAFRNSLRRYDEMSGIASGLVNYGIMNHQH